MANLIVHCLNDKYNFAGEWCNDPIELNEYDLKYLDSRIDEIWYWYAHGSYEGSGQALVRYGKKYVLIDMGHCSCHGPLENCHIDWEEEGRDLEDLRRALLDDRLRKQTAVLFSAAGASE